MLRCDGCWGSLSTSSEEESSAGFCGEAEDFDDEHEEQDVKYG